MSETIAPHQGDSKDVIDGIEVSGDPNGDDRHPDEIAADLATEMEQRQEQEDDAFREAEPPSAEELGIDVTDLQPKRARLVRFVAWLDRCRQELQTLENGRAAFLEALGVPAVTEARLRKLIEADTSNFLAWMRAGGTGTTKKQARTFERQRLEQQLANDRHTAEVSRAALDQIETDIDGKRVMREREVRAEIDSRFEFGHGLVLAPTKPQRSAHSPVRRRVAIVGHQALAGGPERPVDLRRSLVPALKGILEMRERQSGVGARKRGIELDGHLEEMPRPFVVRTVEPIHVPEAAVMRLPRVQGIRRLQDGAVALDHFDLVGDRCNDTVAYLVQNNQRTPEHLTVDLRPYHSRSAHIGQLHCHSKAIAPAL